jgi:glutaredoxin
LNIVINPYLGVLALSLEVVVMAETNITIYGTIWCGDCIRVRRFLDQKSIPYSFINIDIDKSGEQFVIKTNRGMRSVPTIVFEDETILVEPTTSTLARKLNVPS